MVDLVDINTNDPDIIKYRIKFSRRNKIIVTKEFLKSRNVPCIGSITIYSEDYINESKNITQEKIESIIFQEVLSHLQHEFKSRNENLSHLHTKSMFRIEKIGAFP